MLKSLWKIFEAFIVFALLFVFLRWYIRGHFGKWALFFWIWTIVSIIMFVRQKNRIPEHDNTPGYVYWERNMRDFN